MAETTTISNLPQITIDELTNDTLVPVENVDGTKAANLAQLREKLNSLYVEMVDADLNELKQDGVYECWGTTLNAPTSEVAAWIIQTAEHEGVVVQNAFGLGTTSYSYVYRRRWDGVSWTAWENKIQTLENVKANVDLSNLSAAGQAKFDAKANTDLSNLSTAGQAILNGKANTDASNFTATGKQTVVGWGMPDYTAGISFSNNTNYVAPKNGVAMCVVNLGDFDGVGDTRIYINNNEVFYIAGTSAGSVRNLIYIPVSKGDIIKIYMKRTTTSSLKFYPVKGVN